MKKRLDASFFRANRERLLKLLPDEALVVVAGYGEMQRSHDAAAAFEQEASFWYLSGIEYPDWLMVIDGRTNAATLVSPRVSHSKNIFDGSLDAASALSISGADEVIGANEMKNQWSSLLGGREIYTLFPDPYLKRYGEFTLNPAPAKLMRRLKRHGARIHDCRREVAKLRTIKQMVEIEAIKDAIALTIDAFTVVSEGLHTHAFRAEYEIEACMTYEMRRRGTRAHAYDPIVAGGPRACTLHYTANSEPLIESGLVLIDVGARGSAGYAADITRTYGVGHVSGRAADVHRTVVKAQEEIIRLIAPGLKFEDYQMAVDRIMLGAIESLGLDATRYRDYFPHAVGHGLGVDVHDPLVGYGELTPGMVLTVEPGVYIPEEGIGVRIEDDILVTSDGHENLSGSLATGL